MSSLSFPGWTSRPTGLSAIPVTAVEDSGLLAEQPLKPKTAAKDNTSPFRRGLKGLQAANCNLEPGGGLGHEIETSQHHQHCTGNAQPEAGYENLPDDQSLPGGERNHDAQAVDDVKNHRTNSEK